MGIASKEIIRQHWLSKVSSSPYKWGKAIGLSAIDAIHDDCDCCWACGVSCKTQICHIVPKALGGDDTEGNLFLMCIHCHKHSPDTNIPALLFNWISKRLHPIERAFNEINSYLTHACDIDKEQLVSFLKAHGASHSNKVSNSTKRSLIEHFVETQL